MGIQCISEWWSEKLAGDAQWEYGTPPAGNANYAWLLHILYHLKPSGLAGVVLANGSMSSNQNNEGAIRKEMIERDVVDCMTQVEAFFAFMEKNGEQPLTIPRPLSQETYKEMWMLRYQQHLGNLSFLELLDKYEEILGISPHSGSD